jgi:hypothetical protein
MPDQNLEQSVFLHAIELATPAERAAYLDDACRSNPQCSTLIKRGSFIAI